MHDFLPIDPSQPEEGIRISSNVIDLVGRILASAVKRAEAGDWKMRGIQRKARKSALKITLRRK